MVPEAGIEPARPLFTKAADFKSDVSTYFTTRACSLNCIKDVNFGMDCISTSGSIWHQ